MHLHIMVYKITALLFGINTIIIAVFCSKLTRQNVKNYTYDQNSIIHRV